MSNNRSLEFSYSKTITHAPFFRTRSPSILCLIPFDQVMIPKLDRSPEVLIPHWIWEVYCHCWNHESLDTRGIKTSERPKVWIPNFHKHTRDLTLKSLDTLMHWLTQHINVWTPDLHSSIQLKFGYPTMFWQFSRGSLDTTRTGLDTCFSFSVRYQNFSERRT